MARLLSTVTAAMLAALLAAGAGAEGIRLKARAAGAASLLPADGRGYWILEFPRAVEPETLAALAGAGVRVTAGLSAEAVAVSAQNDTDFASYGALKAHIFAPEYKLSPLLAAENALLMAEFHADVPPDSARAVVEAAGLQVVEYPDVLPHQLMVAGDPRRLTALAAWDEVAYLFPAAPEMAAGARMAACPGGALATPPVGP